MLLIIDYNLTKDKPVITLKYERLNLYNSL